MVWYGKYENEDNGPPKKKGEDEEVRLTARYSNKDDEPPSMSEYDLSPEELEYIDYVFMLFENNIRWNIKSGKEKTIEELKEMAKNNGLDINEWRKKENKKI